MERSVRSVVIAYPERYLLSCIKGVRYQPNNNISGHLCKGCAEGLELDCEMTHGFLDGHWLPHACIECNGPLIKVRPVASCRLCFSAYRYLMNDLAVHGITHEHIFRLSYDVDSHRITDLILRE